MNQIYLFKIFQNFLSELLYSELPDVTYSLAVTVSKSSLKETFVLCYMYLVFCARAHKKELNDNFLVPPTLIPKQNDKCQNN